MPGHPPSALALIAALGVGCSPRNLVAVGTRLADDAAVADAPAPDAAPDPPAADAAPDRPEVGPEPDAAADASDDVTADVPAPMPAPGLIGYWPLDDGAGTRAADLSGHANDGTLQRAEAGALWAPGRVGGAVNLGGSAWVHVRASPSLDSPAQTGALTVAAWVWATRYAPGLEFDFIVSQQIGGTPFDNWGLALRGGKPTFAIVTDFISGPQAVTLKRWVHLAATFDAATIRVYVDGRQVISQPTTRRIGSETRPVIIGGNANDGSGRPNELFDGYVDEVRLYNRALSAAEIAALAR